MKIRKVLILPLIVSMLLGTLMIFPVSAPKLATIGVEPEETIDLGLVPASTFTVNIMIRDVEDLVGFEFKLAYDTAVLTATDVEFGGIFTNFAELIELIVDAEGWLYYAVAEWTLPVPQPFTGDGTAAIIHFTVDSLGGSDLDLYDTALGAPPDPTDPLTPVPIAHEALDGYFSNVFPWPRQEVTLAMRKAWPEHHTYGLADDEDDSNDLFAIVRNDGTVGTWVTVVFERLTAQGIPIDEWETDPMWLPAGAMYGHEKLDRYSRPFTMLSEGKYYWTVQCKADTDGDTVPDQLMGRIKTFSFNVVPSLG